MFRIFVVCVLLIGNSVARRTYISTLPNGHAVPNPCGFGDQYWSGVGHTNPRGGGAQNLFGSDFASEGHSWTFALCQKDSDGDGNSNGKELGDPFCQWYIGGPPPSGSASGHPGVCEPMGQNGCASVNMNITC